MKQISLLIGLLFLASCITVQPCAVSEPITDIDFDTNQVDKIIDGIVIKENPYIQTLELKGTVVPYNGEALEWSENQKQCTCKCCEK